MTSPTGSRFGRVERLAYETIDLLAALNDAIEPPDQVSLAIALAVLEHDLEDVRSRLIGAAAR